MGCGSFGTDKILVGLHLVGLAGLRDGFLKADRSDLSGQDELQELLLATVAVDNYIPSGSEALYRRALWREYLRYRGDDFSDFFSEIEIGITGNAGSDRDRFLEMTRVVFRHLELTALIAFLPPVADAVNPQLWISGEPIVVGHLSQEKFKTAIHRTISDW